MIVSAWTMLAAAVVVLLLLTGTVMFFYAVSRLISRQIGDIRSALQQPRGVQTLDKPN